MTPYVIAIAAENSVALEVRVKRDMTFLTHVGRAYASITSAGTIEEAYQIAERWSRKKFPVSKNWVMHIESVCAIEDRALLSEDLVVGFIAAARVCRLLDERTPKLPFCVRHNNSVEAFVSDKCLEEAHIHAKAQLSFRYPEEDGYTHYVDIKPITPLYCIAVARQEARKRQKNGGYDPGPVSTSMENVIPLSKYR